MAAGTHAESRRARIEEGAGRVRRVHGQRRVAEAADVAHEWRVVGQRRAQRRERVQHRRAAAVCLVKVPHERL